MIVLYTDFGSNGPYLGQMESVIFQQLPSEKVINLMADAPSDPVHAGYLLAALRRSFPTGAVFLSIIDPGVGGQRMALILEADGQYFVGPDNGLFNTIGAHSQQVRWWGIDWRPEQLSSSFHGRDLFAPAAVRLIKKDLEHVAAKVPGPDILNWPLDLAEIIYCDHYGNAMTGLRYQSHMAGRTLQCGDLPPVPWAETFCLVPEGTAFWYCNSAGLVEIAVNRGRADKLPGVQPGAAIQLV